MKYKWLLLDIDNTLLNFTDGARRALSTALNQNGIELSGHLQKVYQKANHETWEEFERGLITAKRLRSLRFERFFDRANISGIDPRDFNTLFLELLVELSEAYDGVIPLLHHLKEKYRLSVITNGLKEVQRPRLERLHMTHFFDSIIVSDEIGLAKPDKAYFDYALSSIDHDYDTDQILVVGDNIHSDIIGGQNAGLRTCWISHNRLNATDVKADYEIASFVEINKIL